MQFTREPIIETIITPKDGYRLLLRASRGGSEEFFVDMVEVISFGHGSFYRSLDKPKSFVVPTGDYDVVEVREARMAIKSASVEKVKIAGGKKEDDEKSEKKSRSKRTRKKKTEEKPAEEKSEEKPAKKETKKSAPKAESEAPKEPRTLIPPPPTLISETMAKKPEEPVEVADE